MWLLYVVVLFCLGTYNLVGNAYFNELAWIDDRNYPGGPLAFILDQESLPIENAGNAVGILITFFTDGLLVSFRLYSANLTGRADCKAALAMLCRVAEMVHHGDPRPHVPRSNG